MLSIYNREVRQRRRAKQKLSRGRKENEIYLRTIEFLSLLYKYYVYRRKCILINFKFKFSLLNFIKIYFIFFN